MDRAWFGWRYAREFVAAGVVIGACIAWRLAAPGQAADAQPPAKPAEAVRPVALVDGAEITADQLAAECLARHGSAVLETIVNRRIIEQSCARAGVLVTAADVDAEIDAMSRRFNVPRDKWIDLIRQERGVTERQYADDIVWPMIALRRLASGVVEPTAAEVQEAFEKQFGPAVKARIIVCRTRADAEADHEQFDGETTE